MRRCGRACMEAVNRFEDEKHNVYNNRCIVAGTCIQVNLYHERKLNMNIIKWISTTNELPWQEEIINLSEMGNQKLSVIGEDQTIEGFGGCFNEIGWDALLRLPKEKVDEAMRALFSEEGCHFNFCRLPIGASDYAMEWYDLSPMEEDYEMNHFTIERDYKYLIPYVKSALEINPDIRFFSSPWSPPLWMKFPKAYNHGTMRKEHDVLRAYANYFVKYVQAYEAEGIHIDQIHIQNEPMSDQKFPSCIWTGEEFRVFIKDYIGPAFKEHGIKAKIWLGTLNGPETDYRALYTRYDNYANLVLSDNDAYPYIEGVSYQWAGKYAIQQTRDSWPELKYMQSENECGDGKNTWEYAKYIFELTNHYFRNGVNYYIYWNMVLPLKGKSTWGWEQNTMINMNEDTKDLVYNHEYYLMKHYAHFIKPGAKRLKTKGGFTSNAIAFQNPDGEIVLVIANLFDKERLFTFEYKGENISVSLKKNSFHTICIK